MVTLLCMQPEHKKSAYAFSNSLATGCQGIKSCRRFKREIELFQKLRRLFHISLILRTDKIEGIKFGLPVTCHCNLTFQLATEGYFHPFIF